MLMSNDRIYYRKMIDLKYDYDRKELVLQPEYQRFFTWDIEKQSKLIESIVLGYPLNPLHLSEEEHGMEVIDGQQRLTTVFRFIDNKFVLTKLKQLPQLNGKTYKQLDTQVQKAILNYSIGIFPYSGEDKKLKFEIFERLNCGSTTLTAQELRNCIYHGPLNNMIRRLATLEVTKKLLQMDSKRMKDGELILGFFAIQETDLLNKHIHSTKELLDEYMAANRVIGDIEAKGMENDWKEFAELCMLIFERPFRREKSKNRMFNEGLYYACCYVVPRYSTRVVEHAEELKQALFDFTHSEAYVATVTGNFYSGMRTHKLAIAVDDIFRRICKGEEVK